MDADQQRLDFIGIAPIAGFWRRLIAFLVDCLILGVPTLLVGLALFSLASGLGQTGRLVGFVVALLYFGLMNSRIGGGQTLGKRLLGIRVVDRAGGMLSPGRSIARFLVLAVPYFLNGARFDPDGRWGAVPDGVLGVVLIFVVFGGIGAIAYLYLFNRRTRQSLHDLAVGSFVVRGPAVAIPAALATPRLHVMIAGCWLALAAAVPAIGLWTVQKSPSLTESARLSGELQTAIEDRLGIGPVAVVAGSTTIMTADTTATTSFAKVTAQPAASAGDPGEVIDAIARVVLDLHPDLLGNQLLIVEVRTGFDLGLAHWSSSRTESHDVADWQARLGRVPDQARRV